MTDIVERLHVVRDHLRTGRFGQREVWEEWLTEAADDIERLRTQCGGNCRYWEGRWRDEKFDNDRLRAALLRFYQGPCPDCSGDCGSANPPVIACIMMEARAALEPKP